METPIYVAGASGKRFGWVSRLTGYWKPIGPGKGTIRGTMIVGPDGVPFVLQRVGDAKHHSYVRYFAGQLEPVFASAGRTTAAMSRGDWGGGINRANIDRLAHEQGLVICRWASAPRRGRSRRARIIGCTPTYDTMVKDPVDRACLDSIRFQPLEFDISREQSIDAWGRAQSFVSQYSSMKIQIATDYVIETYHPVSRWAGVAFGYRITKTPLPGRRLG